MLLAAERAEIIECARKLAGDELTVGTSGNLSVRRDDLLAITPSGVDYDDLTPDQVIVTDLAGKVVEGTGSPSSELPMHRLIYRHSDAQAVVHTHGVYSTVVGTLRTQTPPVHYMLVLHGGPVRVAPYALFGSEELSQVVAQAMEDRFAVLMQNHGAVCYGDRLRVAYNRALYLEWVCRVWVTAAGVGSPRLLTEEQLDEVARGLGNYGR